MCLLHPWVLIPSRQLKQQACPSFEWVQEKKKRGGGGITFTQWVTSPVNQPPNHPIIHPTTYKTHNKPSCQLTKKEGFHQCDGWGGGQSWIFYIVNHTYLHGLNLCHKHQGHKDRTCTISSTSTFNLCFVLFFMLCVRWCESVCVDATPVWDPTKCSKIDVKSTDPREWSLSKVHQFQSWLVRCSCPWRFLRPWHAEITHATQSMIHAIFNNAMQ